jgi:hypothetical protein
MIMYSGFISNQVRSWPVSIPSAKTGNAPTQPGRIAEKMGFRETSGFVL